MERKFVCMYKAFMRTEALLTAAQFMQLPQVLDENNPSHYELDDGELIETPSMTLGQNYIRGEILLALSRFLAETKLGEALHEIDVQLDLNSIYNPDVMYWDAQRFRTIDHYSVPVQGLRFPTAISCAEWPSTSELASTPYGSSTTIPWRSKSSNLRGGASSPPAEHSRFRLCSPASRCQPRNFFLPLILPQ